jgi:hypothetical protein
MTACQKTRMVLAVLVCLNLAIFGAKELRRVLA